MCTVSWIQSNDEYEVFFNRDELRTRLRAHPPKLQEWHGVKYIAPVDADAGGLWIGVNEFGLSAFLLNYYHARSYSKPGKRYTTRGRLVRDLMDCRTVKEAESRLRTRSFSKYRPFTIAVIEPRKPVLTLQWDGHSAIDIDRDSIRPLSSSSFEAEKVIGHRIELFRNLEEHTASLDSEAIIDYQLTPDDERGAYGVCMRRSDAQTVSFSHIKVGKKNIEFRYIPEEVHKRVFLPTLTLDRI